MIHVYYSNQIFGRPLWEYSFRFVLRVGPCICMVQNKGTKIYRVILVPLDHSIYLYKIRRSE